MIKKYRLKNKNKLSEYDKKYRSENKEKIYKKQREYRLNNLEKDRAKSRKRRSMKSYVNENFTADLEAITYKIFNDKCYNCGTTKTLNIDHHRPLSKGNPLTLSNAVVLCKSCNSSKGDKNPEIFYGIKKCNRLDKKLEKIARLHFKK